MTLPSRRSSSFMRSCLSLSELRGAVGACWTAGSSGVPSSPRSQPWSQWRQARWAAARASARACRRCGFSGLPRLCVRAVACRMGGSSHVCRWDARDRTEGVRGRVLRRGEVRGGGGPAQPTLLQTFTNTFRNVITAGDSVGRVPYFWSILSPTFVAGGTGLLEACVHVLDVDHDADRSGREARDRGCSCPRWGIPRPA